MQYYNAKLVSIIDLATWMSNTKIQLCLFLSAGESGSADILPEEHTGRARSVEVIAPDLNAGRPMRRRQVSTRLQGSYVQNGLLQKAMTVPQSPMSPDAATANLLQ